MAWWLKLVKSSLWWLGGVVLLVLEAIVFIFSPNPRTKIWWTSKLKKIQIYWKANHSKIFSFSLLFILKFNNHLAKYNFQVLQFFHYCSDNSGTRHHNNLQMLWWMSYWMLYQAPCQRLNFMSNFMFNVKLNGYQCSCRMSWQVYHENAGRVPCWMWCEMAAEV